MIFRDKELKAATLFALRFTTKEVMKECDLTELQIRNLRKDREFVLKIQEIQNSLKLIAFEEAKDNISRDLRQFRSDFRKSSQKLNDISNIFLEKVALAVEQFDFSEITSNKLPQYIKAASEIHQIAMESRLKSLGLEKLLQMNDEFEQIIESRRQELSASIDSELPKLPEGD